MKQFFKFTLASLLAIILFFTVLFIALAGIIAAFGTEGDVRVPPKTVLHLTLSEPLYDRGSDNPLDNLDFGDFSAAPRPGLTEILGAIGRAAKDNHIGGIYLDLSVLSAGFAATEEIRNALINFKAEKKFVVSYGEIYSQKAYYLASVANEVYLNPAGVIEFKGLSSEVTFYKGALEKLGIEAQVIRHGEFKSAAEPYMLDSMSAENRVQTRALVQSVWDHVVSHISLSRDIDIADLNRMADSLSIRKPADALKHRLVDDLLYEDEVKAVLEQKLKLKEGAKLSLLSVTKYNRAPGKTPSRRPQDKIAVIYASGIVQGGKTANNDVMGSAKIAETICKARQDAKVKAIVLRVNSPGGSALASDIIWREMVLARLEKPVVVSMGDVAASGGYYIACVADTIVAGPSTVTGSIGVFGVLPNMQRLFNEKLGITFDTVNTNAHSAFGSLTRPLRPLEHEAIQHMIEFIYEDFVAKVAEGRKMEKARVDSLGGGRVWSGLDAQRAGLVDVLGGLESAIEIAAGMAKLKEYRVSRLPEQKDLLQQLMSDFSEDASAQALRDRLGPYYADYLRLKSLADIQGVQARMPFDVVLR